MLTPPLPFQKRMHAQPRVHLDYWSTKCEDLVLENRETIMVKELQQPVN